MKTIPILKTTDDQGIDVISPATPFPKDAIAITCNGTEYTVYQTGDTMPTLSEG